MTTSPTDIESELSFAYLKAIAARAGYECVQATRIADNKGIDATITGCGDFGKDAFSQATILIQLKSTFEKLETTKSHIKYDLKIKTYDDSRVDSENSMYVVLLLLPRDKGKWLTSTRSLLSLRTCAYWFSNRGAPPISNVSTRRVLIPKRNRLTVKQLEMLLIKSAKSERVPHVNSV